MSFSHDVTIAVDTGADVISKKQTATAGAELKLDEAIPNPSTNLAVALAFVKAKLQYIYIVSDAALTLYTNDAGSGSPQDTIALAAGVPFFWVKRSETGAIANPFAGNVTSLYVTNASGGAAQLQVRGIVDPT